MKPSDGEKPILRWVFTIVQSARDLRRYIPLVRAPSKTGGYVKWQELYAACVSATDTDRLENLVYEAEGAMFLRFQELAREPRVSNEAEELKQATAGLLEIKIRKLGWPDPLKENNRPPTTFSVQRSQEGL